MINKKQATQALFAGFEERFRDGTLNPESEDYFYGSHDRWSTAIAALGHAPAGGNILDIGAWDGSLCYALKKLGYNPAAVDWFNDTKDSVWEKLGIEWHRCNIEADPLPFPDNTFSGVYMGQLLEHFTYSPRKPMAEIRRVLAPGGLLVVDVPNVGELHNFYRLIRGKNILYDYRKHYIDDEPIIYKGRPYFNRHNREFTANDLRVLAEACGFSALQVRYIRSVRHNKKGFRRLEVLGSYLRDLVPLFRKSLMLVAKKAG